MTNTNDTWEELTADDARLLREADNYQQEVSAVKRLSESRRAQLLWKNLAEYANADLTAGGKGFEELHAALRRLLLHTRVTHNVDFIMKGSEDVSFRSDASRYQGDLRGLFAWLCKPKSNSELRVPALQFLESNAHGEHWHIDLDNDWTRLEFDEHKDPIFYFAKKVEYDSIMAPICKFIFEEIDPPPAEGLPIRICRRPKCGKFYVRERSPKQFCSASCRAQVHQSKSQRLAHKYVRRLEKIDDLNLLRNKFRSPALQTRLASIESQWPDWAIEKIKQIKERVLTYRPPIRTKS